MISRRVYGPALGSGIGSDQALSAFDANWSYVSGTELTVRTATNDVREAASDAGVSRWIGRTLTHQRIMSTLGINGGTPGIHVLCDANGNGYDAQWSQGDNFVTLQRNTNNGATHTTLATGGAVASGSVYVAQLTAIILINAVRLILLDDLNGVIADVLDTDALRRTAGAPALQIYNGTGLLASHKNVSIFAEDAHHAPSGGVAMGLPMIL